MRRRKGYHGRLFSEPQPQPAASTHEHQSLTLTRPVPRLVCRATHMVRFGSDELKVFTGSDDMTVRCWDVPTESEGIVFEGHQVHAPCSLWPLPRPCCFRRRFLPALPRCWWLL